MINGGGFYVGLAYATAYGTLFFYAFQLHSRLRRARREADNVPDGENLAGKSR